MANFSKFAQKLLANEGGYVNNPLDPGGETYRGISRVFNPGWSGWVLLDGRKPIKKGTIFPDLENNVLSFYQKNYWNTINASQIKTQEVAELLADWLVNGGFSAKKIQQVLVDMGQKIVVDGVIGPITIQALNAVNQKAFWQKILDLRKSYYQALVDQFPSQMEFLNGWMNRLKSFKAPSTSTALVVGGLGIGAFFLYKLIQNSNVHHR